MASPTVIRPFCSLLAILATSAVEPFIIKEDLSGDFILELGTSYQLQAVAAAGSSPLGRATVRGPSLSSDSGLAARITPAAAVGLASRAGKRAK